MSKYYLPYCTRCRVDLAPYEGTRSRVWVYCDACLIKVYPGSAKRKGLIKELPPEPVKPIEPKKAEKPIQLTLFEVLKVQPLPPCICTGAFNHQEVK